MMEKEEKISLPLLDVLITNRNVDITALVYKKLTHMGQYLCSTSKHLQSIMYGVIRTLYKRAATICSTPKILQNEYSSVFEKIVNCVYNSKIINKVMVTDK